MSPQLVREGNTMAVNCEHASTKIPCMMAPDFVSIAGSGIIASEILTLKFHVKPS